jgi:hypothetical protein
LSHCRYQASYQAARRRHPPNLYRCSRHCPPRSIYWSLPTSR